VAFATAPEEVVGPHDVDRPLHDAAAGPAGYDLEHLVWSDPDAPWDDFDLVVVRSTWDYLERLEAFRTWLAEVDRLGTLHNPGPVITWNLDKRYLLELAAAGVPVIPTTVCEDAAAVQAALAGVAGEVVVKPVVSAGSRLTGRFTRGDAEAPALAARILAEGTAVMVQPAVASVATDGEVCTLVFGGAVSHAVRKGPLLELGGGLVGGSYGHTLTPETLTPECRAVVDAAVEAVQVLVAERFGVREPLLYARIDVVTLDDGSPAVLEVELAEPALFFEMDPDAAGRFASEVARRVGLTSH